MGYEGVRASTETGSLPGDRKATRVAPTFGGRHTRRIEATRKTAAPQRLRGSGCLAVFANRRRECNYLLALEEPLDIAL